MALFDDVLGDLTRRPQGRNRRISSNEQPNWNDGNFDMTRLKPGEEFTLPVLQGPGVINHIWMTSHAGGVNELNALSIRIYWDDREEPGVEAPLGDFFAQGHGKPVTVESFPVQVSPTGSLTCYWRMPFQKSARIVIINDNPDRSSGLYWQVDWVELAELPQDTMYFHARYRQEHPAVMGQDYLLADLEGEGKYVGTVMSVTMGQDGWFGEGDDFFYIDGEEIPSLQGTGSEDYFNDAWGYRQRVSTWFGQPTWTGWSAGDYGICYRWHVLDPVHFTQSLKVTMEHKGNHAESADGFYVERPDFFSSVAYWYQLGEPKPFGELPAWSERRVPWEISHLVRTFKTAQASGESRVKVESVGFFGGRPALSWGGAKQGDTLSLPFTVAETGNYALRLLAFRLPKYGVCAVCVDDKTALERVGFAATEDFAEEDLLLGTLALEAGAHTLTLRLLETLTGDTALSLETLSLLRLPVPGGREVKNDNEAHFIRIGIGRATYAYRLAYGELPDSLEVLVAAGVMSERYLSDENGFALRSWREGEFLAVESTAPNGWRHQWLGADARR